MQQEASEIMEVVVSISNTETELEPVKEKSVVQGIHRTTWFTYRIVNLKMYGRYQYNQLTMYGGCVITTETSLIAGYTLGAAFKVLFDVLMNVKEKTTLFNPLLEDIKSMLNPLEPLIEEIEKYKKVLDRPKEELQHFENQMKNGAALVQKCTKLCPWKGYKKYRHCKELLDLDKSLQRLLAIFRGPERRDMETVRNISTEVSQIEYEIDAWHAVPHVPPF